MTNKNLYEVDPGQIIIYPFKLEEVPKIGLSLVRTSPQPVDLYDPIDQLQKSKYSDISSPYVEFANLDNNSPEKLLYYANTHGIPCSPSLDFLWTTFSFDEVQKITKKEFLAPKYIKWFPDFSDLLKPYPIKKFVEKIWNMRGTLARKAIAEGDETPEMISFFDDMVKKYEGHQVDGSQDRRRSAALYVRGETTLRTEGCYSTLDIHLDRDPIFVRTLRHRLLLQALYIALIEDISVPTRKCKDPKCGNFYEVDYKGRMYCTHDCGVRVAQRRRYYKRKEAKEKKHGKAKRKR